MTQERQAVIAMIGVMWTVLGAADGGAVRVEHLGQPCRARNVLAGRVVADRNGGGEWFVLTNMNETSGAELIFIDFQRDTGRVFRAPAGAGSWALNEVPGDRLIVGTFYDGQFMVFDLKKMAFVKTVGFPGESYIWNLAMGGDGRIYGGTYGGGKLGAFDLNTYTVEDCGAPAPPNLYLRYVSPTPDGRILCSFGTEKPTVLLYDPATKRFEPLPKTLEGASAGVVWNGYFLAGARAFKGRSFEVVDPPFPTPPAEKGAWGVDDYLTTEDTVFLRQGNAIYRYTKGDKELTLIAEIDLRGGRLLAGSRSGAVLGVRGQDYFVIRPGDKDLRLKPIPAESGARPTLFLKADERGRVWGGPTFGQTLFYIDTRANKTVNTATVCDAGGEVYDVTFRGGTVYAASYSGGDLIRYDPDQPWDQWNGKNPKTIASLGARGYIRPTGGILVGPDGKLYSGWMARYGTYGGAIAITDPDAGATELIENPLGEQAVDGLAVDARFAYVGTSLAANGLPNKQGEAAKFGMVELASREVTFVQDFPGVGGIGNVVYDANTKRVALTVAGQIRRFDPAAKQFIPCLVDAAPRVTSSSLAAPGDGKVYYGREKSLMALDMQSGQAEHIVDLPANIANVTVGPGGVVYVSCGVDVYRVRRDLRRRKAPSPPKPSNAAIW